MMYHRNRNADQRGWNHNRQDVTPDLFRMQTWLQSAMYESHPAKQGQHIHAHPDPADTDTTSAQGGEHNGWNQ